MRLLYEECADVVFGRVRRLCGDDATAEDLSQDAWVRAFQKIDQFDGEASFCGWVYTLASNLTIDHLRREKVLQFVDVENSSPSITVKNSPDLAVERVVLEKCLDKLPEGYRTVLLLRVLDGMSHAEIGTKLGIASVTSRSQFHKARAKMVDCLQRAA